jgi:hypothetical protein
MNDTFESTILGQPDDDAFQLNVSFHTAVVFTIEGDFFEGLFSDPIIIWSCILTYMASLVGCGFLLYIVWFERTGMAVNFRTVTNQLHSNVCIAVSSSKTRYNLGLSYYLLLLFTLLIHP